MRDQKRLYRELKREIKKHGNRQRRRHLHNSLRDHPDAAQWDEFEFRQKNSSQWLNGIDEKGA